MQYYGCTWCCTGQGRYAGCLPGRLCAACWAGWSACREGGAGYSRQGAGAPLCAEQYRPLLSAAGAPSLRRAVALLEDGVPLHERDSAQRCFSPSMPECVTFSHFLIVSHFQACLDGVSRRSIRCLNRRARTLSVVSLCETLLGGNRTLLIAVTLCGGILGL